MRMRAMWPAATPVCAGPARAWEGQVLEAGTPGSVAGSCLVVLQQTATSRADDLAGRYGAAATRTFGAALKGFSIRANETRPSAWRPPPRLPASCGTMSSASPTCSGPRRRGGWTGSTRRARRSARAKATPPPRPTSLDDAVRGATPAQVSAALVNAATPGKISNATAGTPNRLLFAAG